MGGVLQKAWVITDCRVAHSFGHARSCDPSDLDEIDVIAPRELLPFCDGLLES
jgi:hypothetical protein